MVSTLALSFVTRTSQPCVLSLKLSIFVCDARNGRRHVAVCGTFEAPESDVDWHLDTARESTTCAVAEVIPSPTKAMLTTSQLRSIGSNNPFLAQ